MKEKSFIKAFTKRSKSGKLVAVASTESKDRVGDSLKMEDWDLEHFLKNPVLQAGHDYRPQYTIGVAEDVRFENRQLVFTPKFHNITKLAQEIGKMYEEGFLKTWSVGFIPKEANLEQKKNQLLEVSAVAVPANAEALTFSQKGLSLEKFIKDAVNESGDDVTKWVKEQIRDVVKKEEIIAEEVPGGEAERNVNLIPRMIYAGFERKLSSLDTEWNSELELKTAGANPDKLMAMHAWVEIDNPNFNKNDSKFFKFPHHKGDNDQNTVWKGVVNAMVSLFRTKDFSQADKIAAYEHLRLHCLQFGKIAPALKEYTEAEIKNMEENNLELDTKVWDDGETSIRYRVTDPELFEQDSFRTIVLKKDSPTISAVVGKLKGEDTTTLQSLIFSKDEGWTLEEAQKWVEEHPDVKALDTEDVPMMPENANPEMDKPEMMKIETGETNGHKHLATCDKENGNGETDMVENHKHNVVEWVVQEAGENPHTHTLEKPMMEEEAKPEDKPAEMPMESMKGIKYKERWNTSLSKSFDIEAVETKPANFEYDLFTKYLDCRVKDIYQNDVTVALPLLGNMLHAVKAVLSDKFDLIDTRSFNWDGDEKPPTYEVVKLNSTKSDDFLIHGVQFLKEKETGNELAVKFQPNWNSFSMKFVSKNSNRDWNRQVVETIQKYSQENNLLKGEMFALNGEFISKTDEKWDDVILDINIKTAVVNSVNQFKKKAGEFTSRGMIMLGPPGTGKTKTCRTLMNDVDSSFIWITSKDFNRYGTVESISLAFDLARQLNPVILLFEDIDTWIKDYAVDLLKTEMDGLRQNKAVYTILTTNHPDQLPDALIDRPGRFHDVLEFGLPSGELRKSMLEKWVGEQLNVISEDNITKIINGTEGMSGAHIFELVQFAKIMTEENEMMIDDALIKSLDKLQKQRELIGALRTKGMEVEIKEGRVLSTKNISVIKEAITAQKNSVRVLEKLLEEASTSVEADVQTPKAQKENVNSNHKGRIESQKRNNEQKITSEAIALRTLQYIAGQSCYALNKLKNK